MKVTNRSLAYHRTDTVRFVGITGAPKWHQGRVIPQCHGCGEVVLDEIKRACKVIWHLNCYHRARRSGSLPTTPRRTEPWSCAECGESDPAKQSPGGGRLCRKDWNANRRARRQDRSRPVAPLPYPECRVCTMRSPFLDLDDRCTLCVREGLTHPDPADWRDLRKRVEVAA